MSENNHLVWCMANDWNGSKPCNCGAPSSLAEPAGGSVDNSHEKSRQEKMPDAMPDVYCPVIHDPMPDIFSMG